MGQVNYIPQPIKRALIAVTSNQTANAELVAAVTGKKIRVLAFTLSPVAAMALLFRTGASTAISGSYVFVGTAFGPFSAGFNPAGWFETTSGEALNTVSDTASNYFGDITYIEV